MSEPPTAEQRKADAEADSAELDRDKKRLELEEWKAQGTAREVEATAGIRTAVKEMTPDLSGVDRGSTTLPESGTIFQALLGGRALQGAASQVARSVKATCGDDYRVLVTTDLDLATRDSRYLSAGQQLRHLAGLVARFRALDPAGAPVEGTPMLKLIPGLVGGAALSAALAAGPAGAAATAAAAVLPGLLSLLSAKRTVSTSSATVDDTTAMTAVAGALALADPGAVVVVDQVRLLVPGAVAQAWSDLDTGCTELAAELDDMEQSDGADQERLAAGRQLLASCRVALAAMIDLPEGGGPNVLTMATMQEALHGDEFEAILVVKGAAASATQLVDDRPLRFADPLSIVSSATVSYLLVDHRNGSRVRAGGLAHGVAQIHGKIGDQLTLPT